jgi:NADP-dependent 3-hydroxy acid dehydrogenase YdfG
LDPKGNVAIVTGASSGIGLATARLLSSKGAKVPLVARSKDKLEKLATELPDSINRSRKLMMKKATSGQATTHFHPQTAAATERQLQLETAADKVVRSKPPQQLTKRKQIRNQTS